MDSECGLSSWNAGTLSMTENNWVPTGNPHCLQPECVLYWHNTDPLTAKFQITFPSPPFYMCSSYVFPWITNLKKSEWSCESDTIQGCSMKWLLCTCSFSTEMASFDFCIDISVTIFSRRPSWSRSGRFLFCGDSRAWWNLSIQDRTSFIFFSHCSHSSLVSWSNAFFKSKMYKYKIKNSHQQNSKIPLSWWT